jgi:hypothetical protein
MKQSEIQVGKVYHNGKEKWHYSERKVIDSGPHLLLYSSQENTDCLRYKVVQGYRLGEEGNITRRQFASWAKAEVKEAP